MGRAPCCSKVGLHRGPWTPKEDALLTRYIQAHGEGQWRSLPKKAGLLRCGKSCRLRWMNYLRPDIKRGNITPQEDDLIIRMHSLLGNRWSLIAGRLPGRTDNEIKNYWNTHLSKRLRKQESTDSPLETAKKRNNNGGGNKKKKPTKKNNNTKTNEQHEPEKTIVYLPKPIRVAAFSTLRTDSNFTIDSNSASGSTSQGANKEVNNGFWGNPNMCENDGGGFNFLDKNNDLVNGSEMECQSGDFMLGDYGSLEKLYEEYLQLLNNDVNQAELESFAESVLI